MDLSPPDRNHRSCRLGRADGAGEPALGYVWIQGGLLKLGDHVGASTMRRILKRHRIPPAPLRHTDTSWRQFLRVQTASMLAVDFLHVDFSKSYIWRPRAARAVRPPYCRSAACCCLVSRFSRHWASVSFHFPCSRIAPP